MNLLLANGKSVGNSYADSHSGAKRISAATFENAIDTFINKILQQLESDDMKGTNLHKNWNDVNAEKEDFETSRFRKLEAQLSCDPDDVEQKLILDHLREAHGNGEKALAKIASDASIEGDPPSRMLHLQLFVISLYTIIG